MFYIFIELSVLYYYIYNILIAKHNFFIKIFIKLLESIKQLESCVLLYVV
jgi:hypothetical protein